MNGYVPSSRYVLKVTAMETTTQPNFQVVVPSGDIPHPYSVLRSTLQTSGIILPYYTRLVMHAVSVCQQNPHVGPVQYKGSRFPTLNVSVKQAIFVDVGSPFCFNTLLAASKGCRVMRYSLSLLAVIPTKHFPEVFGCVAVSTSSLLMPCYAKNHYG